MLAAVVRSGLALAFAGMGVAHLVPGPARTMRAMIPAALQRPGLPSAAALVAGTGACELAGAAGLLVPRTRRAAGGALLLFLAAVFPANVVAARSPERFGAAAIPVGPRLAAQVALGAAVAWAAWSRR